MNPQAQTMQGRPNVGGGSGKRAVFYYSQFCSHSGNMLRLISEGGLASHFALVCVDRDKHLIPRFVDRVPIVYLAGGPGGNPPPRILADNLLSRYVSQLYEQQQQLRNQQQHQQQPRTPMQQQGTRTPPPPPRSTEPVASQQNQGLGGGDFSSGYSWLAGSDGFGGPPEGEGSNGQFLSADMEFPRIDTPPDDGVHANNAATAAGVPGRGMAVAIGGGGSYAGMHSSSSAPQQQQQYSQQQPPMLLPPDAPLAPPPFQSPIQPQTNFGKAEINMDSILAARAQEEQMWKQTF